MTEQLNDQIPVYPYSNTLSEQEWKANTPGAIPSSEPPVVSAPLESPMVAVSNNNNGKVPGWFYVLFIITLIIFFVVTAMLVLSYTQKKSFVPDIFKKNEPTVIPTTGVEPSAIISQPSELLISPTPASVSASVDWNLPELTKTDEVLDLKQDIEALDLTHLDKEENELERQMSPFLTK
jgi:hypothetical protein